MEEGADFASPGSPSASGLLWWLSIRHALFLCCTLSLPLVTCRFRRLCLIPAATCYCPTSVGGTESSSSELCLHSATYHDTTGISGTFRRRMEDRDISFWGRCITPSQLPSGTQASSGALRRQARKKLAKSRHWITVFAG